MLLCEIFEEQWIRSCMRIKCKWNSSIGNDHSTHERLIDWLVEYFNVYCFFEVVQCLRRVAQWTTADDLPLGGDEISHQSFDLFRRGWFLNFVNPMIYLLNRVFVQIKKDFILSHFRSLRRLMQRPDPLKYWLRSVLLDFLCSYENRSYYLVVYRSFQDKIGFIHEV